MEWTDQILRHLIDDEDDAGQPNVSGKAGSVRFQLIYGTTSSGRAFLKVPDAVYERGWVAYKRQPNRWQQVAFAIMRGRRYSRGGLPQFELDAQRSGNRERVTLGLVARGRDRRKMLRVIYWTLLV